MAKKEKKKKEPKRKPKYGLFSCVGYMYRLLWKYERRLAFVGIFTVPISLCLSALALYTPSALLSVLEGSERFSYIALVIVGLLLAKLLFDLVNGILNNRISNAEHYVLKRMEYTSLNREVNPDGVELSGGEIQKLLLARLLYKNPFCIILDEPTAALDPIAEDRIYRRYNEIASHATSVFISHRLASTRFCDRIFLLDGANFAEVGTHEELMRLNGKYRELFDVQSKYYREEESDHEQ